MSTAEVKKRIEKISALYEIESSKYAKEEQKQWLYNKKYAPKIARILSSETR
jgi:hypothetical protein